MNRILIIDDDKELCTLIKQSVLQKNIEADFCYSGKFGLLQLKEKEYQLVILDVMIPGFDSFETLEQIRKENSLPILMLTSKNDSASKVRGLRAGADDYLTKLFDMDELIARIVSLIRCYTRFNQKDGQPQMLEFDGLTIDFNSRSIITINGDFELPPKEFDLLLLLAKNQGKILTKQQIYEEVWGEEYVYDDSNIMAIISRLRKKIPEVQNSMFSIFAAVLCGSLILEVNGVAYKLFVALEMGIFITAGTLPLIVLVVFFSKTYIFFILLCVFYSVLSLTAESCFGVLPKVLCWLIPIPLTTLWSAGDMTQYGVRVLGYLYICSLQPFRQSPF